MSDTRQTNRTNAEIEALLREDAAGEISPDAGRVSRRVVARLRSDAAVRTRGHAGRIGATLDDEGGVPRWFLAAAVVAISALAGWMLFGPSGGAPSGPHRGTNPVAGRGGSTLPGRILASAMGPQNEMLKREARALVGAGWDLAGRVLSGIPIELVKPADATTRGSS